MTYDLLQTILVAIIALAVLAEVASSRHYRRKHLWLQTGNAKVGLLTERRLRRAGLRGSFRDVVAVTDALEDPEREQDGGESLFHAVSVNGRGDGA